MKTVIVTGSSGLVGSECVRSYCESGWRVVGIDNNMRRHFFGPDGSTLRNRKRLMRQFPRQFEPHDLDIRNKSGLNSLFRHIGKKVSAVIHTAAQPSHDWATRAPDVDFAVNALGTQNVLEAVRKYCPGAVFIFTSTNKVYGDNPNRLPIKEKKTRWEIDSRHQYADGIDETMSIDNCRHSIFGVSKVAADVMVQEYAKCYGLRTGIFRAGCITGVAHAAAPLHGFLAYLAKCVSSGIPYKVIGYQGKQVRDNIHAADLVSAFRCFQENPRPGEVYNIGGGRENSCSVLEAITLCEDISGKRLRWSYEPVPRAGDHIWYITNMKKFRLHYPDWLLEHKLGSVVSELCVDVHTID